MARRKVRRDADADLEIRLPDGRIVAVEIKVMGSGMVVSESVGPAIMHVSGASAAAVGAASVLGWYVRSNAPWLLGDDAAIRNDWQTVGDDLWRAVGEFMTGNEANGEQSRLFDPGEYAKSPS